MTVIRRCFIHVGAILCLVVAVVRLTSVQVSAASNNGSKDRERVVFSNESLHLNGEHLKVTLLEVNYGPGESSSSHSHPCAVVAYIVEGSVRSQVKGEPERIYRAGDTFYEPPNGVHLVSANASSTKPARFVAYLLCDHEGPIDNSVSHENH